MADAYSITRGNPRASASEEPDISQVGFESPVVLRPQGTIRVENCSGESGGGPCDGFTLEIYNVMGQEDVYRRENGKRVNNGGQARIVLTTNEPSAITSIEYADNPGDEDNPLLDKAWEVSSERETYHEVFVPVSPDSLYAFKAYVEASECPDTAETGIYYFGTGDEIVVKAEPGDLSTYTLSVLTLGISKTLTADEFTDDSSNPTPLSTDQTTSSQTLSTKPAPTAHQQAIEITTSVSYTVS